MGAGINHLSKQNRSSSGPLPHDSPSAGDPARVLCLQGYVRCVKWTCLCDGWFQVSPPWASGPLWCQIKRCFRACLGGIIPPAVWMEQGGCVSLPFCPCPASVLSSPGSGPSRSDWGLPGSTPLRPQAAPLAALATSSRRACRWLLSFQPQVSKHLMTNLSRNRYRYVYAK